MKKTKRKIINILVALSFLATLILPMATPAFAATDNYAISVPKVQNDADDVTLGILTIREDEDSDGLFAENDIITINLPDGVTYAEEPTVSNFVYYVGSDDPTIVLDFLAGSDNYISFKITNAGDKKAEHRIYVYFGKDNDGNEYADSKVDIDSDVTGDIKVEIDAAGTAVTSEFVTVARVVEGDTTTTISSVKTLPIDGEGAIGTIRISENAAGVLEASTTEFIELVLPNDYKWTEAKVTGVGVGAELQETSLNSDTLKIKVTSGSKGKGQAGFITISNAKITTPDDADEGEVEMTVKGNEVTEEDIVIAKVGDFGFKVTVDGDVKTIVAGKKDQKIADITIDDIVNGSWVKGRTVKLSLPSWAEWEDLPGSVNQLGNSSLNKDKDELKYTTTGNDGKAELKKMTVNIDADAPEGDLVVTISGSAGIEDELVVAKIVAPFKVTADKPEVRIGVQNQELGDITLTESEDGAIEEGKWVVFKAPSGMTFAETPDVEVTDGDIDIDDEDIDDEYFAFKVTGESAKAASTIKISNITFDVDRTIPAGDIKFDVYLIDEDCDETSGTDIKDVNDIDGNRKYLDKVCSVAVGKVITSAPGEVSNEAVFVIGQSTFTLNGVEQTMDVAPYLKYDRTYLPVRFVANACGVADDNIMWNQAEQSVVLIKGDRVVKMVIGSNTMLINGVPFVMDVAPELVDPPGRTMMPLRWVAQALGCAVDWDETTQTVTVQG